MVSGFPENSEVFAITHVHAPCTDSDFDINNFLPLIKGELLTVKKAQSNTQTWVRNAYGIEGLVRNNHVSPADLYCHEDFFLADFTSQMAEKILADKPNGSFIIRTNSKDVAKVIISAKFDTVTHYSFNKHGGGIEYDGVLYQSIPSFINKCSYSGVFKGNLELWIKQSDINIPQVSSSMASAVNKLFLNFRIVAGSLAIAVEDFGSLNKLCLEVHKGRQYTILRASRNTQWLIVRDEYDNEGYVPGSILECFIPQWFHGRIDRDEASILLNKNSRDGTFLVKERSTKPGTYALSVWSPDMKIIHVPLAYHEGKITTGLSADLPKFDCIKTMVDYYRSQTRFWTSNSECVRILFPLSRKETSVPDEIRTMDMKSVDLYFRALKEGKEHVRDIRLMVIGHHGAGKTTLTERLMGKQFRRVGSTNGIEIHLRQCQYNVATGIWLNPRPGSSIMDDETHRLRLIRVLESPDEERTSVFKELLHRNSTNESLFDLSTRSNTNHSLHSSMSSIPTGEISSSRDVSGRESPLVKDTSETDSSPVKPEASLNGSHPSRESLKLRFDLNANNETVFGTGDNGDSGVSDENGIRYPSIDGDYQITNEDVPRYKFSEGTLKVIESTFGRKRNLSGTENKIGFISMWDFAGQYIFYATHQVFLTPRAVYLLVLDLTKDLDDFVIDEEFPLEAPEMQGRLVKDYGNFWMRSIHTFCGEVPGHPPVILVGTKSSEMNLEQGQTVESAAGKYFEKFRMMLENSPVAEHLQPEQFAVECSIDDKEIDRLKEAIVEVAKRQMHWNQEIPGKWLPLERALSKLGGEKRIISLDEVNSLDGEMDVRIKDSEEIVLFLRFHHAVGSLIYFDDEELAGYVVLDPQWIIDAFKSLITAQQFCKLRPQLRTLWKNLQEKACLHDKLIDEIWREDREGHFMEHRDILLSYMEKLDIIARPKVKLEDGQKQEIDFYFVPSLLRMKGQKDVSDLDKGKISERTPNLCFAFQEGFIPPMVFQRMLGACLSRYTIFRKVDEDQIFCDLGVFYLDSQHCFIFWLEDDVMKVRVVNLVENKVKSSLCDKLRRFLTNQLDRELCRYQNNTSFSVCIECLMPKKGSGSLINCKELLRDEKLPCCAHSQPHIVQSKIILQSWYPDYIEVPVGEVTLNWIDALPSVIRKREVTLKDLSKIAQSLGFNWEFVIIELGLPQVDIDQCKIDNKDQVAMQIYHCLLKWKSRDGYQANIETLVKAIQANQAVEADWEAIKNVVDRI
ncbi:uncharacterized protein LOC128240533 [Mya arenaria]|uniref:uncharacterized protein LOC128240533 n=1 Tax=Mya arenaria TaxID=6604 RepID=UPI0022E178DE|nr:uncharacterized protein LOC128240533 [Mya arenaria]